MPQSEHPRDLVRFGDFELDPATGELTHAGSTIRLQPQPLKVLLALVRRPGELVTREQLKQEVMPDSLYGDADHAINLAVTKLRGVLQDSSDKPEFIDTLPRRGYRFVAQVHRASGDGRVLSKARGRISWYWLIAIFITVALVLLFLRLRRGADKFTVVVAAFANATEEPAFDFALRQGLSAQLQRSGSVKLVSDERIAHVLTLMRRPKGARLTNDVALEVCQRTASAATIYGSVATLGKEYVLELKAVNCRTGELLVEEQVGAASKEQVLRGLEESTAKLRERLESLAPTLKDGNTAEYVTTSSLEALQAYSLGRGAMLQGRDDSVAITLMQRAIALDPGFAMAYVDLGVLYKGMRQNARSADAVRKGYELRDGVSAREALQIEARYQDVGVGDLESAQKKYAMWATLYGGDAEPLVSLGAIYRVKGDCNEATGLLHKAHEIAPRDGSVYAGLVDAERCRGGLEAAKSFVREAEKGGVDTPSIHMSSYLVSFVQRDTEGMQKESKYLRGLSGWNAIMLCTEGESAAFAGQFAKSRSLVRRAVDTSLLSDEPEIAANCHAEAALWEALAGNRNEAKQQAEAALLFASSSEVQGRSALALALVGEGQAADQLAKDLAQRFQDDTLVQAYYLPAIRGAIGLMRGDHAQVVDGLSATSTCSVEQAMISYLRGRAYFAVRDGAAAAVEFQKILACPGAVANDVVGALSRLELGRAYRKAGDTEKARAAYGEFLEFWKDADSGKTMKQVKAEYEEIEGKRTIPTHPALKGKGAAPSGWRD